MTANARIDQAQREAAFWKRRYDEQHNTVHRLEDELAAAREFLVATAGRRDICGECSPETGTICIEEPEHEGAHCGPDLRYPAAPGERHSIWASWA